VGHAPVTPVAGGVFDGAGDGFDQSGAVGADDGNDDGALHDG
jgi:hypothetical protein